MVSLYFHVPFCTRKCDYCHFYVLPNREDLKVQYMESLWQEWEFRLPELIGKNIATIYFGGGTPALLGAERINTILGWIKDSFSLDASAEITLEANPENVTLELMQAYREAGINRASLGIQTLHDPLLITLGRTHSAKKATEAVHLTAQAGLANISIDLMYDLPDQQLSQWESTLHEITTLPITHLSLYNLTIEPHTLFFKKKNDLLKRIPDEQTSLVMYQTAVDVLQAAGLNQYEISAFTKEDFASKHNTGYWIGRPFLGFGPSAFSYWQGRRFRNAANIRQYAKDLREGRSPVDFEEALDPDAMRRELLAIRLRLLEGVDLEKFQREYGLLQLETLNVLKDLQEQGFVWLDGSRTKLTRRGILFYDTVAVELI